MTDYTYGFGADKEGGTPSWQSMVPGGGSTDWKDYKDMGLPGGMQMPKPGEQPKQPSGAPSAPSGGPRAPGRPKASMWIAPPQWTSDVLKRIQRKARNKLPQVTGNPSAHAAPVKAMYDNLVRMRRIIVDSRPRAKRARDNERLTKARATLDRRWREAASGLLRGSSYESGRQRGQEPSLGAAMVYRRIKFKPINVSFAKQGGASYAKALLADAEEYRKQLDAATAAPSQPSRPSRPQPDRGRPRPSRPDRPVSQYPGPRRPSRPPAVRAGAGGAGVAVAVLGLLLVGAVAVSKQKGK